MLQILSRSHRRICLKMILAVRITIWSISNLQFEINLDMAVDTSSSIDQATPRIYKTPYNCSYFIVCILVVTSQAETTVGVRTFIAHMLKQIFQLTNSLGPSLDRVVLDYEVSGKFINIEI